MLVISHTHIFILRSPHRSFLPPAFPPFLPPFFFQVFSRRPRHHLLGRLHRCSCPQHHPCGTRPPSLPPSLPASLRPPRGSRGQNLTDGHGQSGMRSRAPFLPLLSPSLLLLPYFTSAPYCPLLICTFPPSIPPSLPPCLPSRPCAPPVYSNAPTTAPGPSPWEWWTPSTAAMLGRATKPIVSGWRKRARRCRAMC